MSGEYSIPIHSIPPVGSTDYQGLLASALSRIDSLEKAMAEQVKALQEVRGAHVSTREDILQLREAISGIRTDLGELRKAEGENRAKLETISKQLDESAEQFGKIIGAMTKQSAGAKEQGLAIADVTAQLTDQSTRLETLETKTDLQTKILEGIQSLLPKNRAVLTVAFVAGIAMSGCVAGCFQRLAPKVAPQLFGE